VYVFSYNIPTTVKLPLVAAEEDTGPFTKALVEVAPGKNLIAYRAWMTMDEYLDIIRQVTGVKAINKQLPADTHWEAIPEELREEMTDNAKYFEEFGYEGRDDPSLVHPKDVSSESILKARRLIRIARCRCAVALGRRVGQEAGLEFDLHMRLYG
jgi:hypothetical protein